MQPIQINVQVNVGLNDNVVTLLSALLNKGTAPSTEAAPRPRKPAAKPQAVEQPKPVEQEQPKPEAETTTEQPTEKSVEQPVPTSTAPADDKEYTEVDVRAAMDRTRKRIEGEDYKENTNSELYKKWHRRLTGWFKQTSALFGAEKPSALSDSESRYKFIACCDALNVEGDEFKEDLPF